MIHPMSGDNPLRKRDLPKAKAHAVGIEVTLFPWHLTRLDAWAAEQGIGRSEMIRQLVRDRHRAEKGDGVM